MESKREELKFYGGKIGRFIPLLVALVFIAIAALNKAKIEGYTMAFFIAIVVGVLVTKNQKVYGESLIKGLSKPMFGVIALAIILAAVAGSFVSKSGVIQTLATYIIQLGVTGKVFVACTFLFTCIISFSTGTSVGTYFVVGPILYPVGCLVGSDPAFLIGAIVAGAAFGDNLAPISDTTIASAKTQEMDLGGVVRSRMKYALPVAFVSFILYLLVGSNNIVKDLGEFASLQPRPITLVMLAVPIVIIIACLLKKHLISAISYGIFTGAVLSLITGIFRYTDILAFPGPFKAEGILVTSIIGALPTVALLMVIFPLLGVMEASGMVESMANLVNKLSKNKVGAECTIVGTVGLISMVTGVISVAIIAVGDLVNKLGIKFEIDGYRRANLMDCAGVTFCFIAPWTVHAIVPAMITSNVEGYGIAPATIPFHNFYSWLMLIMLIFAISTGYGRKTKKQK